MRTLEAPVGVSNQVRLVVTSSQGRAEIVDKAPQRTDESPLAIWSRTLELVDRAGVGGAVVAAADRVEGTVREPFHTGSLWLVRPDGYVSVVAGDARPIRDYLGGLRGRGAGEPDVPHEACRGRATVDLQITTSH